MTVSSCTDSPCSDVATRYADALRERLEMRRAEQEAGLEKTANANSDNESARKPNPARLLDITV